MTKTLLLPDLCVLGGGAAGQVVAAGASQMGASVVLIEAGVLGGAALNSGAVPIQALQAAAREPGIVFPAAMERVRRTVAALSVNVSAERLEGLGVTVCPGFGRFTGPAEVTVNDTTVRARRFVIATGAAPLVPAALDNTPYLTWETVWQLRERPEALVVVGGGAEAAALAQAFRRLGSTVTLQAPSRLLPDEDEELADVVRLALRRDGIDLREAADTAAPLPGTVLVAGERRPRLAGLGLEAAGIAHSEHGITVNAGLRTTNRRVYAIGDATGGPASAALATAQAGLVLRNALFRLPVRNDLNTVPVVVATDPELARVGPTEAAARAIHDKLEILRWSMADVDRARIDGTTDGLAKVLLDRRGRVIGAAIAGRHAGDLILPWVLAVRRRLPVTALAELMVPSPTLSEISKKIASSHLMPKLFSDRIRTVVRWLAWLG